MGDELCVFMDLTGLATGTSDPSTATIKVEGDVSTLRKLDAKYLPDIAINVQPDWQAADQDKGHILNRTHYMCPAGTVVLDTVEPVNICNGTIGDMPYNGCRLASDARYRVTIDGANTVGVTSRYNNASGALYPIELAFNHPITGDTIIAVNNAGTRYSVTASADLAARIEIEADEDIYVQLDKRYIPIAEVEYAQPDWNAAADEDGHILNRTHYIEGHIESDITIGEIELASHNLDGSYYVVKSNVPSQISFADGCAYTFGFGDLSLT